MEEVDAVEQQEEELFGVEGQMEVQSDEEDLTNTHDLMNDDLLMQSEEMEEEA